MGQVLQFKPRERDESRLPTENTGQASVVALGDWTFNIVQRVFSSLMLTYWYWRGNEVVMDFEFEEPVAKYLKHPNADSQIWQKMHSVFFEHFCQKLAPKNRVPFTVKKFMKSQVLDERTVRIFFESEIWAGKMVDGESVVEEYYGNLTEEKAELFKCEFMFKLDPKERR